MAEEDMSKEEQIGFHKGSLSTLAKERQEMTKILKPMGLAVAISTKVDNVGLKIERIG